MRLVNGEVRFRSSGRHPRQLDYVANAVEKDQFIIVVDGGSLPATEVAQAQLDLATEDRGSVETLNRAYASAVSRRGEVIDFLSQARRGDTQALQAISNVSVPGSSGLVK